VFVTTAPVFVTRAAVFVMPASGFVMAPSVFVTFGRGTVNVAPVHEMSVSVFVVFAGRFETGAAVHFREGLRSAKPASGRVTVVPGQATVAVGLERGASVSEMTRPGPETTVSVLVMGVPVRETAVPGFVMTQAGPETVATGAEMVAWGAERVANTRLIGGRLSRFGPTATHLRPNSG
jgi:hypothetical protein